MKRATFAKRVGKRAEMDPLTILTILSILAGVLPQIMTLCQPDDEPEPPERAVKRACRDNPILARREIRKALPKDTPRKIRTAESIRLEIVATREKDLRAMMAE